MTEQKEKKRSKLGGILPWLVVVIIGVVLLFLCCFALYRFINEFFSGFDFYEATAEEYTDNADNSDGEDSGFVVDFDALRSVNEDVIGWIYQPGTIINYPIVQGENNNAYLRTTWEGEYLYAGSIFLEATNSPDFSDSVNILYGHNMKNLSMFASLRYYFWNTEEYLAENPYFYLLTPDNGNYRLEVFACLEADAYSDYYATNFSTLNDYWEYLEGVNSNSLITTDVEVGTHDRIVALSTCILSATSSRGRYLVFCKMIEVDVVPVEG